MRGLREDAQTPGENTDDDLERRETDGGDERG